MLSVFAALVRREILLTLRRRVDLLTPMVFFLVVVALFPLASGPDQSSLRTLAPGIVWVAALLSVVLTLPRLFRRDLLDGSLEQLLLAAWPLFWIAGAKIAAHWVTAALPLVLLSPIFALQFDLPPAAAVALTGSLLVGTPVLSAVGALGAALSLNAGGSSVLLPLLVLPLYVPVLVFGCGLVEAAGAGLATSGHYALLAGFALIAIVLAPWATAAALRGST